MRCKLSLLLALSLLAAGCRGGKVVATPPEAAEAGADLSAIVEKATGTVLTAYKAGQVPPAFADPFMAAVDTKVLPLSRRAKTAVAVWKAAADGPAKVQAGEDLKALLVDLEREAQAVFGAALPPAVSASIGNIASDLYDAIGKIRAILAQARAQTNPECILRHCAQQA